MKLRVLIIFGLFCHFTTFAQTKDAVEISVKTVKEDFSDDWAALRHYKEANIKLAPPIKTENRVVFLGSSIFEFWTERDPEFFENKAFVNRGVSGQLAPQLLVRFQQDVIALKPKAVIILAGSNDLASDRGHVTITDIMSSVKSMAELAKLHHIKVILCKYLPINQYPWRKDILNAAAGINSLNIAVDGYAKANGFTVLDYFTALLGDNLGPKPEWTIDGVHPNSEGYKIMETVTKDAIAQALISRY